MENVQEVTTWRLENGENARFNFSVWYQKSVPVKIRCSHYPNCRGESDTILVPCTGFFHPADIAGECPECGSGMTASVSFIR